MRCRKTTILRYRGGMSTAERFDRADFEVSAQKQVETVEAPTLVRTGATSMSSQKRVWPILGLQVANLGDGIMPDHRGRPHEGLDLHAPAGTEVVAARVGRVLRVVDGRQSKCEALHQAGLLVDVHRSATVWCKALCRRRAKLIPEDRGRDPGRDAPCRPCRQLERRW